MSESSKDNIIKREPPAGMPSKQYSIWVEIRMRLGGGFVSTPQEGPESEITDKLEDAKNRLEDSVRSTLKKENPNIQSVTLEWDK